LPDFSSGDGSGQFRKDAGRLETLADAWIACGLDLARSQRKNAAQKPKDSW